MVRLIIIGIAIGVVTGIGVYTFVYAKGYSYMSNNPNSCANCHVMNEQFDAWQKSSHHTVATCNDCHTPHDLVGKYYTKASNGFDPNHRAQSSGHRTGMSILPSDHGRIDNGIGAGSRV
jgi:cytochrome c nitrite reductase small subunit